jgi:molecular chaperone GrpE
MSKSNGQAELRAEVQQKAEQQKEIHEPELLPPDDPNDGFAEKQEAAPPAEAPSAKVEPIRASGELEKLRTERDTLFDRLARLQAEFDNFRKRSQKESADFRDYALADAARNLLPVIDNFSLALKNAGSNPDDFKKGVELIHKQLQDVLQKMNVQRVSAQGQPFDPRVHEAIEMVESNDVEDNHVLEELQPGYKIKERLLRPAMVRVAKNTKQVN